MSTFTTRPLTAEETESLIRKLTIALGVNGKDAALRAIVQVSGVGIFAIEDDDAPVTQIDVSEWTRLREVDEYAAAQGVGRAEAINSLVSDALSHRLNEPGMGPLIARLVHEHQESQTMNTNDVCDECGQHWPTEGHSEACGNGGAAIEYGQPATKPAF